MDPQRNRELTRQVRIALADPRKLAKALGLVDNASEKQARGIIVRCPAHDDRGRANLSITRGGDGTARAKCHACGYTGDALTLVATVHGLDMRTDFKKVVLMGAELSGNAALLAELEDGKPRPDRIPLPEPASIPDPQYPENIEDFWSKTLPIDTDKETCAMLHARGIDCGRVMALNLARVIPTRGKLPPWATFGKRTWRQTGHRLVVRSWGGDGSLLGVRAWRVTDSDTPKRLPPAGCRAAGLVLSDRNGWRLLNGHGVGTLFIVEGEPDWLAASLAAPGGFAVWGIGSGSWSPEAAEAARAARRVVVATHADDAGDRYAAHVLKDLPRASRWRPPSDLDECGSELQHLMGTVAKWHFVPHQLGD